MKILDKIYSKFEGFQCKGICQDYCGAVLFNEEEAARNGISAGFHTDKALKCDFLTGMGTCEIYENRPFLCRAFGAIDTPLLKCPHGCAPVLTEQEGSALCNQYRGLP